MSRKGGARLRALAVLVQHLHPDLDAEAAIAAGFVAVDGRVRRNPRSLVRRDASIRLRSAAEPPPLRGEAKLAAALTAFGVDVRDRVALDLGAAAGGFTRVLLRAGARRVYALDAGHGQLLGSLRADPAVVNLERTNLGELDTALVPEPVGVVTADLSYLPLADAIPQLAGRVVLEPGADLLALVKPQFELGLATAPTQPHELATALAHASTGIERAGWRVAGSRDSPVRGARGARELLLHARWRC